MGGVKILRIPSSILTSDEEPPLDRGGGTERLRRRVMAAYAATPSHEKMYPEAQPTGTSLTRNWIYNKKKYNENFHIE